MRSNFELGNAAIISEQRNLIQICVRDVVQRERVNPVRRRGEPEMCKMTMSKYAKITIVACIQQQIVNNNNNAEDDDDTDTNKKHNGTTFPITIQLQKNTLRPRNGIRLAYIIRWIPPADPRNIEWTV